MPTFCASFRCRSLKSATTKSRDFSTKAISSAAKTHQHPSEGTHSIGGRSLCSPISRGSYSRRGIDILETRCADPNSSLVKARFSRCNPREFQLIGQARGVNILANLETPFASETLFGGLL